jgi:hypothetical protein
MAVRTSRRSRRSVTLRDLIGEEEWAIALERFQPTGHRLVEKGEFRRLSDPMVLAFPASFSIVLRVDQLDRSLDEIERDAAA